MNRIFVFSVFMVFLSGCFGSDSESSSGEVESESETKKVNNEITVTEKKPDNVPGIRKALGDVEYLYWVPGGVYKDNYVAVLGGDASDPYSIKVISKEGEVKKAINVCCTSKGKAIPVSKALVTTDGAFYAGGVRGINSLYRSVDGAVWEKLMPKEGARSLKMKFVSLERSRSLEKKYLRDNGHFNMLELIAVDENDNVFVRSDYSGHRIGLIDHKTGSGSFYDDTMDERYKADVVNGIYIDRHGVMYAEAKINDGKDYPWVVLKSEDKGLSFSDISNNGEMQFRGVSWGGDLLLRDPSVGSGYLLNGVPVTNAFYRGKTGSPHYYLYPDGMIAVVSGFDRQFIEYSMDEGEQFYEFRTPEDQFIKEVYGREAGAGNVPYY